MFSEGIDASVPGLQGRAFVHQTSVVIYAFPSPDAETVVRLHQGDPFDILPRQAETPEGWLAVRTATGQSGFVKANSKVTTREHLLLEREKIGRGYALGRGKMIMGAGIFLFGVITCVAPFVTARPDGPFVIYYGAVAVGAGEFLWGLEQVTNVRRSLGKFDAIWQAALPK